jgi:RNA polymerase sigma-70 factor (ECF subfamily)
MDATFPRDNTISAPDGGDPARQRLRLVVSTSPAEPPERDPQLDRWMVAVAAHHDREAFACLFKYFGPRLKGWLWRTGSSIDEAEEIAQDAFVNLWRKAAQFDASRANVGSWLFTIARNLRVDRRRAIHDTWTTLDDMEALDVADSRSSQEDSVSRRQHDERVRAAMSRLTDDQRELVKLSFYEDMSHARIAAELKLPLGTVKTRLRRAATLLRGLLEECRP